MHFCEGDTIDFDKLGAGTVSKEQRWKFHVTEDTDYASTIKFPCAGNRGSGLSSK